LVNFLLHMEALESNRKLGLICDVEQ